VTTWCTAQDVYTIAKATVTDDLVAQAGANIDVECARPYDVFVAGVPNGGVSQISTLDLYWLKLACAYQAAWIPSQPDLYARTDVKQIGRGTGSLQLSDTALVIAPLAKRALNRVSWLKSRSVHVPGPMDEYMRGEDFGWHDQGPI
jgi:hypothetical protein